MADTSTTPLVLTSPGPGSVETGGAGADTFYASQGNDTLTGGAGADLFVFQTQPWSPDHITDFQVGTDHLDLSALLQQAGYTGSDPVADHYIVLASDGNGGTIVRFDASGQANIDGHWPNTIIDLDGVSPTGLTWSELSVGGSGGGSTGGGAGDGSGGTGQGSTGVLSTDTSVTTALSDGGHVQVTLQSGDEFAIQKYDASGAAVGPENLWSLQNEATREIAVSAAPDGGYAVATEFTAPGGAWVEVETFDAHGQQISATPTGGPAGPLASITATAGEGYVVGLDPNATTQAATTQATTGYELLDAHGNQLGSTVQFAGTVQSVTADAQGDAVVTWSDVGTARTFTFNPNDTSDTAQVGAPTMVLDDQSGAQVGFGDTTSDASPTLRVDVSQVGELHVGLESGTAALSADAGSVVQVTADDVARGYVDVSLATHGDGQYTAFARFVDQAGAASSFTETAFTEQATSGSGGTGGTGGTGGAEGQVFTSPGPGSVETGTAGADTFYASAGADTLTGGDGADVFVFNSTPWSPVHITDFQVGTDHLDLSALLQQAGYTGSDPVADHYIVLADDGNGGTVVRFDSAGEANINGHWPTTIIDLDGVSSANLTWNELSVGGGGASSGTGGTGGPPAGQVYVSPAPHAVETGAAGADTFYASQGGDQLTGGAGADLFVFNRDPWQPDTITDFQVGTDHLDLTALLQQVGYTGSDPVADGYISLTDDGNGGTLVRFDSDGTGPNPEYPNTIIDLEGVSSHGLTWSELSVPWTPSSGSGGTGSSGGTPGQLITSPDGWSTEVGTPGNDTFIASQGGDTLTGGAGADVFALPTTPWQAVTITDFTPGEDKLDLSYLLKQAGYTGSDPIADHYITVEDDGSGGSLIRYEASGQADINGHWPTTIIDLQGVAPSRVSESDWIIH